MSPHTFFFVNSIRIRSFLLLFLLSAEGCLFTRPDPVAPPVKLPGVFSRTGNAPAPKRWWTAFGCNELNRLVETALEDNPGLRVVWNRLEQTRAVARREGADLLPAISGSDGVERSVTETDPPKMRSYDTDFVLGLAASYELDLWGRIRYGIGAAGIDVMASREDLAAAAISLSAEVADAWFRLLQFRLDRDILDDRIALNESHLASMTLRFRKGLVEALDVLQQKQELESVRGERAAILASLGVQQHRLAVLLGRAPGTFKPPEGGALPEPPPLPASGSVRDWILRRPDLRAAFFRVQAADLRAAAALADRFPTLTLSAGASTSADRIRDLFDNWAASIAADLLGPIFEAGRRLAEADRADAFREERLQQFGSVLLEALEEVENALVRELHQRNHVNSLAAQLELSRQAVSRTWSGYLAGSTDFLRVLTTRISHRRTERTLLSAHRDLLLHRVALYRALAGDWSRDVEPLDLEEDEP